jgi:HD-like signal output (HDOD) protein
MTIIKEKKIMKQINTDLENLPSLPESIVRINNICNNPDTSIKDLIDEIQKDSSASATMLRVANSAMFSQQRISSIPKAVSLLGKGLTKTFLLNNAISNVFNIDFTPYNINAEEYMLYNSIRAKIAYTILFKEAEETQDLLAEETQDLLATATQLSTIGQILVSKNILDNNKQDIFSEDLEYDEDIDYAEVSHIGVSTLEISSKILEYWKIDEDITHIIKHSKNLEAVEQAIENNERNLSLILKNFLIVNTIKLNCKIDLKDELIDFAQENGINYKLYKNSIEELLQ